VNVSPVQFARANFASSIAQKLRYSGVSATDLELEITESAVMDDLDRALRQMRMLRNLGVQLTIDDFGTGNSSLAYLRTLPLSRLKVDRTFIRDIRHELERPPLLASIVQMAHALNMSVVAEGVETATQLAVVREMGCEDVQGFFYAKPLAPADVLPWVKARVAKAA
jgi:EAL domain-containing protein (putative c-di-GMP-specific phosphodiesterase class I)